MKKLRSILIILLVCIGEVCSSEAGAVSSIGGMSVDASIPPIPSGVCNAGRTLNLINIENFTVPLATADSGTGSIFKAASTENSHGGVGYGVAVNGAGNAQTLITFDLDTALITVLGSSTTIVANNPDLAAAVRANIYDNTRIASGGFLNAGTKVIAPCTGGSVNCLHWRGYTNTTLTVDTTDLGVLTSSGFFILYMDEITQTYWVAYTTAGGSTIRKFSSSLNSISAIADTPNLYGDITSDGTYIYTTINLGGTYNIRRIRISDLAITDFALFSTNVATAIYHYNGNLYVAVAQAGTGNIKRVNTTSMTVTGTLVLGVSEAILPGGQLFDTANNRLYVVTLDSVTTTNYRRVNLNTFINEQTLGVAVRGQPFGTGFDLPHQRIWQAGITGVGVGNQYILQKVSLCS